MYVLSVKQPWAELLTTGQKTIELRSWTTTYRGPVAIAASLARCKHPDTEQWSRLDGARGHIVAVVHLVDVHPATIADEKRACCRPVDGEYAWVVENARRVVPVRHVGGLGLRRLPHDVVQLLTQC